MNFSRFQSYMRRPKFFRHAWANLKLLAFYLRSLPNLIEWKRHRRAYSTITCEQGARPTSSLHIVYVSSYARAREFKLAYAARLFGHRVTLIAARVQSNEMVDQHFNSYYKAVSPWKILTLIDEIQPDVVHLFVNSDNTRMILVLLFAPAPVVYDPYDCLQGMIKPEYQYNRLEIKAERICFARADHICTRSLEPLYLRQHFRYKIPSTTYFPEYCWHPPQQRNPRKVGRDEELHVVYCGGVWPEDRYPKKEFGYSQYIEIGRALAKQCIHLHIYPAPVPGKTDTKTFYSLYLKEDETNPYFHFHKSLPYPELMREMAQYDAALHIMGTSINDDLGRASRPKLDYSTANKLFDYIEIGLPVIIHNGRHQRAIVRHYGQAVEVSDISSIRLALIHAISKERRKNGEGYLAYHAKRLNEMYIKVAKS